MRRIAAATGFAAAAAAVLVVAASAQKPPAKPQFTDVAPRSKFTYVTNNHYTGRKYFPQPMCGGIAILDYDNDGRMDIYFTNGAKLPEMKKVDATFWHALLRNRGDGTFEDVTVKAGLTGTQMDFSYGVAAGDYDNDGDTDLFVANTGPNVLYRNNGNGTFSDVTAESGAGGKPAETLSVAGAWFDYDNDAQLDLVVSNYTFWTPATDKVCERDGTEFYCHPKIYRAVPHRVYRNLGKGKFADVTAEVGFESSLGKGMGIGIADFNDDGLTDVFIANDTERNFLYMNQGGKYKEVGLLYGVAYNDSGSTVSAMGCDVKDYDNDGLVDVFYNNLMGQIWGLFRNVRGRSFRYISPASLVGQLSQGYSGWSNGFIDYNNDGWKDIYSSNGDVDYLVQNASQPDTIFENVNGKEFRNVSPELGKDFGRPGYQRGSAFADLNNDGAMDLVVTSLNQKPRILLNSGAQGNHWLLLDLRGTSASRDAIGTRVKVTTASGRALYNHVTTSVGFMSSSDRRVHFGLGAEGGPVSVEIRWQGGQTQLLTDVKPDQILKVEQPRS